MQELDHIINSYANVKGEQAGHPMNLKNGAGSGLLDPFDMEILFMPKFNDKVFCINHQDEEMYVIDGELLLHTAKLGDDRKLYHGATAQTLRMFYCGICDYVELYITFSEDASQQDNDHNHAKMDD